MQFNMRNSSINYKKLYFLHSFADSEVKITKTENVGKSGCFLCARLLCMGVIPGLLLLALLHVLRHT